LRVFKNLKTVFQTSFPALDVAKTQQRYQLQYFNGVKSIIVTTNLANWHNSK